MDGIFLNQRGPDSKVELEHQKFIEPECLHYSSEILTRVRYRELFHTA